MTAFLDDVATMTGESWPSILAANDGAEQKRSELRAALEKARLIPADTSVVVYGSLARGELTKGSDVDWTLLVDGQADESHLTIRHAISQIFTNAGLKGPGPTGVFGGLAFSSEIVHRIGGEADTNRNTTQRILLLLESKALGGDAVRARVIKQLLRRYLSDDRGYHLTHGWKVRVPRFLLNDVVRYWRTMAVDFASKRRERNDKGWALRNLKLRMSRKLLFTAGFIACLSCELHPPDPLKDGEKFAGAEAFYDELVRHLERCLEQSPIEALAQELVRYHAKEPARKIIGAYDEFLSVLNGNRRDELDNLGLDDALKNDVFKKAEDTANRFQEGLSEFFFSTNEQLTKAAQRYGVF